ncbi:MAG: N-acetyl sugar amidotransferase [Candidatus Rifleibacteriota bacterium]
MTFNRVCSRCVLDDTAKDICFDENGFCNYCNDFLRKYSTAIFKDQKKKERELENLLTQIKSSGKGKQYDCIIGVSGGVDSSWALVKAVEFGLRPLAVHMDNGWNSELAQNNIENLVKRLGVELFTYVIDWEEYKLFMQAFFEANVIDIEILYDNAMLSVNYEQAANFGCRFILAGTNKATEGVKIPPNWNWLKLDGKNIRAIGETFAKISPKTYPCFSTLKLVWYKFFRRIKWTSILDYVDYNKNQAMDILQKKFSFKPYPYKHYESIFTRFYQGFILPKKFKVDKRKVHFSTLILSNQMSREKALEELAKDPYPSIEELEKDKRFFLKKMGWSDQQLINYLNRPEVPHNFFPSEKPFWETCNKFYEAIFKKP